MKVFYILEQGKLPNDSLTIKKKELFTTEQNLVIFII